MPKNKHNTNDNSVPLPNSPGVRKTSKEEIDDIEEVSHDHHQPINIKKEKITISLDAKIGKMRELLKTKLSQATNAENSHRTNCGHIASYVITVMTALLKNDPIGDIEISLSDSGLESTDKSIALHKVDIKDENNQPTGKMQKRIQNSIVHQTKTGLHANLPFFVGTSINLESKGDDGRPAEVPYVDLTRTELYQTKVKADMLISELKKQAVLHNGIIIGQLDLYRRNTKMPAHVLVFVANPEKVFFIDGQQYDGVKKSGDPILFDLRNHYTFSKPKINETKGEFLDDCFYLIRETIPNELNAEHVQPIEQTHLSMQTHLITQMQPTIHPENYNRDAQPFLLFSNQQTPSPAPSLSPQQLQTTSLAFMMFNALDSFNGASIPFWMINTHLQLNPLMKFVTHLMLFYNSYEHDKLEVFLFKILPNDKGYLADAIAKLQYIDAIFAKQELPITQYMPTPHVCLNLNLLIMVCSLKLNQVEQTLTHTQSNQFRY